MSELDALVDAEGGVGAALLRVPPRPQDIPVTDCDGSFRRYRKKCADGFCCCWRRPNAIHQWEARVFQAFFRGKSSITTFAAGLTTSLGTSDSVSAGRTRGQLCRDYSTQQSVASTTDRPGDSIRFANDDGRVSACTWTGCTSAGFCVGVVFCRKVHIWISLNIHHLQTVFLYQRHFCSITIIDLFHTQPSFTIFTLVIYKGVSGV